MDYSLHKHRHRFCGWAASRAASVLGCRFKGKQGLVILETAGLKHILLSPERLPTPEKLDETHRQWRQAVIEGATEQHLLFTHGVAAKLINIYFKAGFVCGGHESDPRVQALHPPIDGVLLDELYRQDVGGLRSEWRVARQVRWSKLDSDQYERVVTAIRTALGADAPLWQIERYWRGYQ